MYVIYYYMYYAIVVVMVFIIFTSNVHCTMYSVHCTVHNGLHRDPHGDSYIYNIPQFDIIKI